MKRKSTLLVTVLAKLQLDPDQAIEAPPSFQPVPAEPMGKVFPCAMVLWVKTVNLKAGMYLFAAAMLSAMTARADVKPASVFSDNMVLQRDKPLPVWGKADPGEKVTVKIAGQTQETTAGADGKWKLALAALKLGEPLEMTVAGKNTLLLKNILVGDVWLCSGQSNMARPVPYAQNAAAELAAAQYPATRFFTVPNVTAPDGPSDEITSTGWAACTPETAASFSAVGYFFGKYLHKELDVPIGLINSSWGGTPIEAWTDAESLAAVASGAASQAASKRQVAAYDPEKARAAHEAALTKWNDDKAKVQAEGKEFKVPQPQFVESPLASRNYPSTLYNGMIAPLIPFAIRGVIWYQGESSVGLGKSYRIVFPAMIEGWRKNWGQGDFPFYYVQIANYGGAAQTPIQEHGWVDVQESQWATLALKNTGMAVTNDIGDAKDVHPENKQDVGKRLALWALAKEYGRDIVYSGPLYKSCKIEGGKVRLFFDCVGGGLVSRDGQPLKRFAVAGEDKKFFHAKATIDGDTVLVSSKDVPHPVAVRYAWANNPEGANLANKEDLPASLFRTDQW